MFGLLGMASINLVLLAAPDIYFGRGALAAVAVRPATLTRGVLSMILTSLVALVATVGAVGIVGIGAGSMVIALAAIGALWLSSSFEHRHVWEAVGDEDGGEEGEPRRDERSVGGLSLYIGLCAVLIRTSGFHSFDDRRRDRHHDRACCRHGRVRADRLRDVPAGTEFDHRRSSAKRFQLAIGDIFAASIFNLLLIAVADTFYSPRSGASGGWSLRGHRGYPGLADDQDLHRRASRAQGPDHPSHGL